MAFIVITNEEKVKANFAPQTAAGNPGVIDGEVVLTVLSGDLTITADVDGKLNTVVSGVELGTFQVEAKADVDMGEGVVELVEVFDVIVVQAGVSNLGIGFGTPELK